MELRRNEKTGAYTVELEVGVTKEEFDAACDQAFRKNVGKIQIPGFRRGKAPRKMIEKIYGVGVFYEDAVNASYPAAYDAAVAEAGITPVAQPELEILDITAEGFAFKAIVTVRPEAALGDYRSIRVAKPAVEVTDEDIDRELNRMAERNGRIETVERPAQSGDTVCIAYEGFVDDVPFEGGKSDDYDLKLGSGTFIPGFEDQIVGRSTGEEFDVVVTFPEEYQAEELAGKAAVFKTKINEIHETILPEIDDEFAKDVSEYDTLAELREHTAEDLKKNREMAANNEFEAEILRKLSEVLETEIPEVMYENAIDNIVQDFSYRMSMQGISMEQYVQMTGTTMEDFRGNFRERAENQVKVGLALDALIAAEGLEASEEEIETGYEKLANENMTVEQIKTYLKPESIAHDVKSEKAINLLKKIAVSEAEAAPKKPRAKKPAAKKAEVAEAVAEDTAEVAPVEVAAEENPIETEE